jgi:CRP-like cAMP-binding protein
MDAETEIPAEVLARLSAVPALSVLPPRVLERLAIDAVEVTAPPGSAIITEGEPGRHFYVIGTGTVVVSRGGHALREIGPGEWFGELALLRDVPRTATVTAKGEVALWAVDRNAFLASVGAAASALDAVEGHGQKHYQ